MDAFKSLIIRNLSSKKVLLFFLLATIAYLLMLFVTIPKVMAFSDEMRLLDMMPMGYDLSYVTKLLTTLGQEGRDTYLYNQIPLDMIYPLLFGIGYCLILAFFLNKMNKLEAPYLYLCLLPLIAGKADYLENIGIITLLKSYPDISESMVSLTNVFSIVKSSSTTLYFIILIVTLLVLGIKNINNKH